MNHTETHRVRFSKQAQRQLRETVIMSNLSALCATVNNKSLTQKGWTVAADYESGTSDTPWTKLPGSDGYEYTYRYFVTVTFKSDDRKPVRSDFEGILNKLYEKANTPALGSWTLDTINGAPFAYNPEAAAVLPAGSVEYTEVSIPGNWEDNFSHLFGLDAQVKRSLMALEAAIMSNFANRFHCAFIGPPGCGKSDICRSIKRALGSDAVWELDGTALTSAGAIKELNNMEILPRVMVIEEIEKANEDALRFLLSVGDTRGEVRKTTARENIQREAKLLVIATVNDAQLFSKLLAGALASRFANKIWFKRPSREMRALILEREIRKVDGDMRWIQPTLDFCEAQGIDDPREIIAHCLCGRDLLLTGEYQTMMSATAQPDPDEEMTLEV